MRRNNGFLSGRLLSLALLVATLATSCQGKPQTSAAPPALPVKLQLIEPNQVEDSTEYVGSLQAVETVELRPEIEGRITAVAVKYGQLVKPGDLIFQLQPDQTVPQLSSAIANANAFNANVKTAQANLLVARANVVKAQANLELQQVNYRRVKLMVAEGVQPQVDLDEQTKSLEEAIATLKADQESVRAAQSAVAQAKADLRNAQSAVVTAVVPVQFKSVRSPIVGIVGNINLKVGDYVNTGQSLTTITQNNLLDLLISIPSSRAPQVRTGITVELLEPKTNEVLSTGEIFFISPQVNSGAQSITTRARFPNPTGKLRNGQYVKARVIWSRKPGVLIPATAISQIAGENFVFIAQNGSCKKGDPPTEATKIVCQRLVQLGTVQGQSYQVLEGLKAGDTIAVSGILNLRNGVAIKPES
ncbi:RND transporter [Neosynechococcus sphagnicola sy1]|uniref:RND transporter n=1 Tax=Neosynechococcus sphagnicola sy1 TaxID=1497020 RepID=A0A098TLN9_9CYAN|nr:efflux RND transporter periplasmic adaptor subunit [Neosynechococcus sphagnicola]KGF72787.1 RND transporter [Neosynechococcus sphagnicola sy1]